MNKIHWTNRKNTRPRYQSENLDGRKRKFSGMGRTAKKRGWWFIFTYNVFLHFRRSTTQKKTPVGEDGK